MISDLLDTLATMDSWLAPTLPRLAGDAVPLRLYDTASQAVRPVVPAPGEPARMYVCGITPYDATHLGHAATMITFDLIYRMWTDAGYRVTYVQNVTDIDDPLLERANRDGEDWVVLAMRETALFREDMEKLRLLPPEHYVGAVESIPQIVTRSSGCWRPARRTGWRTVPATCTSTSPRPAGSGTSRTTTAS